LVTQGHTIVVKIFYELCQYNLIFRIPILSTFVCQLAGISLATPGYPAFNVYDIREPCVEFGTCYPKNHLNEVMNSVEYRNGFKVQRGTEFKWEQCSIMPHLALLHDFDAMYSWKLSSLLDRSFIPMLIMNGDKDYITNWRGALAWTNAMRWNMD
jgi:carboxypeptidase C (cathepsin A)